MIKKILVPPKQLISEIVTACVTYEKHRVAETVHRHFPEVDKLVIKINVFFKAISCVLLFKTEAPGIPLTFESVLRLKSETNRRGGMGHYMFLYKYIGFYFQHKIEI